MRESGCGWFVVISGELLCSFEVPQIVVISYMSVAGLSHQLVIVVPQSAGKVGL